MFSIDFVMDTLTDKAHSGLVHDTPSTAMPNSPADRIHEPEPAAVRTAVARRSFATLATTSPAGVPHVAGVLYEIHDGHMYVHTLRTSRKARNVDATGRAAVCVPLRRLPIGPPASVQFQTTAKMLGVDDPAVVAAFAERALRSLTGHGELDLADGSFIRIALPRRLLTYGLGMSLRSLVGDPLGAAGTVEIETWS